MADIEEYAEETAAKIVEAMDSPNVTDGLVRVWIKTAIIKGFSKGRNSVFMEEMRSNILAEHKNKMATNTEVRMPMNRHERRAAKSKK